MKQAFEGLFTELASRIKTGYYVALILPSFFVAAFSSSGFGSKTGRILIWGKIRRSLISFFPPLARYLQLRYGLVGTCAHCSSSCKLLFQCPHWDDKNSRCGIYEHRPSVCRLFPITPADIRDRNLISKQIPCGFRFTHSALKPTVAPELSARKFPR